MTAPKIDPGKGWRLVGDMEMAEVGDQLFLIDNSLRRFYRRRVQPAPADDWLDLATVKIEPGPIWLGRHGESSELFKGGCARNDIVIGRWTHWQPANVPAPPKAPAPEPDLTPEQEACEGWIIDHLCHESD